MQIKRAARSSRRGTRAFCVLECAGCDGMCLPLYMMLTRDEQDAMCHQYRAGPAARLQ
ncbi:MAG: hypothetical protein AAFZ99_04900 [Pseudomonadota bacterium]